MFFFIQAVSGTATRQNHPPRMTCPVQLRVTIHAWRNVWNALTAYGGAKPKFRSRGQKPFF